MVVPKFAVKDSAFSWPVRANASHFSKEAGETTGGTLKRNSTGEELLRGYHRFTKANTKMID